MVQKGVKIEEPSGKLGVLIPGLGAVSTTFIAGVEAIKKKIAQPIGSLTQLGTIRLGKRTERRVPKIQEFVPERRFDAFDQLFARRRGQRLVRPDHVIRPEAVPHALRDRAVYVIDGRDRDPTQVEIALADFQAELREEGFTSGPLSELR